MSVTVACVRLDACGTQFLVTRAAALCRTGPPCHNFSDPSVLQNCGAATRYGFSWAWLCSEYFSDGNIFYIHFIPSGTILKCFCNKVFIHTLNSDTIVGEKNTINSQRVDNYCLFAIRKSNVMQKLNVINTRTVLYLSWLSCLPINQLI